MHFYLTEGLQDAAHQEYIDKCSFSRAVESQTNLVRGGNGGKYIVFSPVSEDELIKIDEIRDTKYKKLRFLYLPHQQTLVVKMMLSMVHQLAASLVERMLWEKTTPMGLGRELADMRGTRYQGLSGTSKEADCAFKPESRPLGTNWPTLVIECGVSETVERLKVDANWWLTNSSGAVGIVLLFSITEADHTILIEKWEMGDMEILKSTPEHPLRTAMAPQLTDSITIPQPADGERSLSLSFTKVFDRGPVRVEDQDGDADDDSLERDIVFTPLDLSQWAAEIWRRSQ